MKDTEKKCCRCGLPFLQGVECYDGQICETRTLHKCQECQFEQGHSQECSSYQEPKNPTECTCPQPQPKDPNQYEIASDCPIHAKVTGKTRGFDEFIGYHIADVGKTIQSIKEIIAHLKAEWGAGVCADYDEYCVQCRATKLVAELEWFLAEEQENLQYSSEKHIPDAGKMV